MTQPVHISSLLVNANPSMLAQVEKSLCTIAIAEVCHIEPNGKIIVVLETPDESAIVQALTEIQLIKGVVSALLVYHQVDETMADYPGSSTPSSTPSSTQ
jgi:nitrate reductase NapD